MSLRLDFVAHDAAKFACRHWHYSGTVPANKQVKLGVWEHDRFIGVVLFGHGPSMPLTKTFGLTPLTLSELTRVALTKHEAPVSRIVAIAVRLFRRQCPGVRLLVSFADPEQGHHGGIYQALGWIYTGQGGGAVHRWRRGSKTYHDRTVQAGLAGPKDSLFAVRQLPKHRYVLQLDVEPRLRARLEAMRTPYPKRTKPRSEATANQAVEGGASPTRALHISAAANG